MAKSKNCHFPLNLFITLWATILYLLYTRKKKRHIYTAARLSVGFALVIFNCFALHRVPWFYIFGVLLLLDKLLVFVIRLLLVTSCWLLFVVVMLLPTEFPVCPIDGETAVTLTDGLQSNCNRNFNMCQIFWQLTFCCCLKHQKCNKRYNKRWS